MTAPVARYTLSLTITVPIDDSEDPQDWTDIYLGPKTKRAIEKDVLKALRKLDGDADCEVMEAVIEDEDSTPADQYRASLTDPRRS